jgi:hypothetical protein
MILNLDREQIIIIQELLLRHNLFGLNSMINDQLTLAHPNNPKLTNTNALKAAETYFSANDISFENFAKWDDEENAYVLSWQKIPRIYIEEQAQGGCGCGK